MRFLLPVFLALSACLSSASAAAPKAAPAKMSAAAAFSRSGTLPKWAEALEQVPEPPSDEPVVVWLAEVHYWAGDKPIHLVNRAVQVNSSSRLSEIGQFSIEFMPAYQKVILHRIAILRGKEVLDRTQSANVRVLDNESDAEKRYYLGAASCHALDGRADVAVPLEASGTVPSDWTVAFMVGVWTESETATPCLSVSFC